MDLPLCKKKTEDEQQFLASCPKKFTVWMLTQSVQLTLFDLCTKNAHVQKIIAKYICDCFEIAGLLKVESQ